VQWDDHVVRLLDPCTGELLREHRRTRRGLVRLDELDASKRKPLTCAAAVSKAKGLGKAIGELSEAIAKQADAGAERSIRGLLSLVKKHGATAVEEASKLALEVGVPTYRFVRRYLDHARREPVTLRQVDPLIRALSQYRDVITERLEASNHEQYGA
jgi:hypothetical protein